MSLKPDQTTPIARHGRDVAPSRDDWDDDQPYELLANTRRRKCVRYLANRPTTDGVAVRELADSVAESLSGDEPAPDRLRRSVYTSMTQHHLDKLDDYNVVDYDREAGAVSTGSNFKLVARASDCSNDRRRVGTIALWTSALTVAVSLGAAAVLPYQFDLTVFSVAALNLVPISLFVWLHVVDDRSVP